MQEMAYSDIHSMSVDPGSLDDGRLSSQGSGEGMGGGNVGVAVALNHRGEYSGGSSELVIGNRSSSQTGNHRKTSVRDWISFKAVCNTDTTKFLPFLFPVIFSGSRGARGGGNSWFRFSIELISHTGGIQCQCKDT